MLACVRHTTRRLLRSATFSTTAVVADAPGSKKWDNEVNKAMTQILEQEAQAPVSMQLTKTPFAVYRVLAPGQPLLPNTLTYKNALVKQRFLKRPAVAPPPSVTRQSDTFHQLNLDPRHFTSNSAVLSHFVTEMGKIKSRNQTNLTAKSQRLVGRTIRRAKMMGIIPILSKGHKRYY